MKKGYFTACVNENLSVAKFRLAISINYDNNINYLLHELRICYIDVCKK